MTPRRTIARAALSALVAALTSGTLYADEAAIRKALEPRLGKLDSVVKSPVPGIWEVVTGARVQYADATGRFLFDGPLKEAGTGKNLSAERQFALLPLRHAVVQTRGTGRNVLVTFEDPNCGFCKRLAPELAKIPNLKLYTFVYPILGADSMEKATNIWCAPDRAASWDAQMMQGKAAPKAKNDCDTSGLHQSVSTGQQLGIRGTPVLFLASGEMVRGFRTAEQLEQLMKAGSAPK